MLGLSNDIEEAVKSIIDGLGYDIDIDLVDDDKLESSMKSKTESFKHAKLMLSRWQKSENSPSNEKLSLYIGQLIDAGNLSINMLRMSLRKQIDFDSIEPHKHHLAVKSKAYLHTAIVEISTAVAELNLQLEGSNNFVLTDNEFKIGYPERFARGDFYGKHNYHKNVLAELDDEDEDEDDDENKTKRKELRTQALNTVYICPNGTIGETVTLDGLNIVLPKVPENRTDILFHDSPIDEQYWRREEMPGELNPDTEVLYAEYILREFRRRREGLWFMNKGRPVYLTGSYYFALQWCKMEDDGGYLNFRYAQLYMSYHTEACVLDPRCLGELFVKSRRTGYTYEKVFRMLNESTSLKNANFGITSKSDEDAKKAFSKFRYAFLNLPFFFRPIVKGREDGRNFLEFSKPSVLTKEAKKKKDTSTDDYLNVLIDYQPTNESSYDGQKLTRYLADEASKWIHKNFLSHWGQVSPTMDEGGVIVGKAFVGSTVNAMKNGGYAFRSLYYQSLLRKRDKTTLRTPSGLYPYFLPAQDNMAEFTDIYGVCHKTVEKGKYFYNTKGLRKTIGSVEFLEARRKSKRKESEIAYNEEVRAFPMDVEEAFRDELEISLFNSDKISDQISGNLSEDMHLRLIRGNFSWKDGVLDSKVVFTPNPKGRFLVSWIPDEELQNRFEMQLGIGGRSFGPLNGDMGALGADPYDISGVVDGGSSSKGELSNGRGSKGAISGVTGFNLGNVPSNHFFLEYVNRAQTAEVFFEDVLMACVFYGMPVLVENNKPRLLYHFKNRGYRNFALTRFDKDVNRLSVTEREIGGIPNTSEDVIQMHSSAIENYINKHVGKIEDTDGSFNMGTMWFNNTLQDWLEFDIRNRTKYDLGISSGLALMAVNRNSYRVKKEEKPIVFNIKKYA